MSSFMLYARGSASDYDDWKMPGWSSKDVIPLLKSVSGLINQTKNIKTHRKYQSLLPFRPSKKKKNRNKNRHWDLTHNFFFFLSFDLQSREQTETYRVRSDEPNEPTHGYQGPLHVSKKQMGFLGHEFHEVVKNYGKIPAVKDLNGMDGLLTFSLTPLFVSLFSLDLICL